MDAERLYRRCLAWELVWGRDQEAAGQGERGGKETRVIRFRKKALLEDNVSEMRSAGWEPRWESYRETPDRPSSPTDRILGRNGEETAKTKRAQTALEIPIPKQAPLLATRRPTLGPARVRVPS